MAARKKNSRRSKAAKKTASRRKTCRYVHPKTGRRCQKLCKPNTPYCGVELHEKWVKKQQQKADAVKAAIGTAFVPIPPAVEEALPEAWRPAFLRFLASGETVSLRQEIAAARVRENQLFTLLDERGNDSVRLERAAKAWQAFRKAMMPESMKDHPRQRERLRQLDAALLAEDADEVTIRFLTPSDIHLEIRRQQAHIGAMVEREARMTEREEGWMRVDQTLAILAEFAEAVEVVAELHGLPPEALGQIRQRVEEIAVAQGSTAPTDGDVN